MGHWDIAHADAVGGPGLGCHHDRGDRLPPAAQGTARADNRPVCAGVVRGGRTFRRGVTGQSSNGPGQDPARSGTDAKAAPNRAGILTGLLWILKELGGPQAALKRSIAVKKVSRRHGRHGLIHSGASWQTSCLAEVYFL